jgi:hypothetical protein
MRSRLHLGKKKIILLYLTSTQASHRNATFSSSSGIWTPVEHLTPHVDPNAHKAQDRCQAIVNCSQAHRAKSPRELVLPFQIEDLIQAAVDEAHQVTHRNKRNLNQSTDVGLHRKAKAASLKSKKRRKISGSRNTVVHRELVSRSSPA